MNPDYEKQLEERVSRALRRLPDLAAPASLMPRVMAEIGCRTVSRWYRQPWQQWPAPWRAISLLLLLASFGGLTYIAWQLANLDGVAEVMGQLELVWSGIRSALNVLGVIVGALVLVVKHAGSGFGLACVAAFGFGCAMCFGLGTVCVRLAMARR
jgi:hypothetical protein